MMGVFDYDFSQENKNHFGNTLDLWAWQSISLLVALTELFVLSWLDASTGRGQLPTIVTFFVLS
jgi:hypothetical protein